MWRRKAIAFALRKAWLSHSKSLPMLVCEFRYWLRLARLAHEWRCSVGETIILEYLDEEYVPAPPGVEEGEWEVINGDCYI